MNYNEYRDMMQIVQSTQRLQVRNTVLINIILLCVLLNFSLLFFGMFKHASGRVVEAQIEELGEVVEEINEQVELIDEVK